jgi:uncharacterized protein YaiL (DUF2058 family)
MAGQKQCSKCKRVLSLNDFYRNHRAKGGLHGQCKSCHCNRSAAAREAVRRAREDERDEVDLRESERAEIEERKRVEHDKKAEEMEGRRAYNAAPIVPHVRDWPPRH